MSSNTATRLRRARKLKGLGVNELAKKCNMEAATISRFENQKIKSMALPTLRRLAKALNVTIDELVVGPLSEETVRA